jgi:hypothetical protein
MPASVMAEALLDASVKAVVPSPAMTAPVQSSEPLPPFSVRAAWKMLVSFCTARA